MAKKDIGAWGKGVYQRDRKRDNAPAAVRAKTEVRRLVLEEMGADKAHVFDAFAGEGTMYDAVWHRAATYIGCDKKWFRDERTCYVCDNVRALRCLELERFNLFDLDSYGSPWEQALIIGRRREMQPGETLGLVITEGSGLNIKLGNMPMAIRHLSGATKALGGSETHISMIRDRCIDGFRQLLGPNVELARRWDAKGGKRIGSSAMLYIGLVFRAPPPRRQRRGGGRRAAGS